MAQLLALPANAQYHEPPSDNEELELVLDPATAVDFDGIPAMPDANIVGNPMKSLAERWPSDLVVAPIPGYSPQLGWQLTLGAGYFLDRKSGQPDAHPSVLGGMAMVSENGSRAFGAGTYLHLFDDRLRVRAGAAYGDVNYRFYGIGNEAGDTGFSLQIEQEAPLYFLSTTYRVWRHLYFGVGYMGGNVETRLRLPIDLPPGFPAVGFDLDIGAWMLPAEIDTRNHEQFPSDGWLVNSRSTFYRRSAGSDFDAEIFMLSANRYWEVFGDDVFAVRGYLRSASGDAPFFLLSTFGGRSDLRGYANGRYRDRSMYAFQGEYRWVVNNRWILTGFAGFGEVMDSFKDVGGNILPATGIGARFVLSQKHRVSLAADIAVGRNGTEFYFGVNEAF